MPKLDSPEIAKPKLDLERRLSCLFYDTHHIVDCSSGAPDDWHQLLQQALKQQQFEPWPGCKAVLLPAGDELNQLAELYRKELDGSLVVDRILQLRQEHGLDTGQVLENDGVANLYSDDVLGLVVEHPSDYSPKQQELINNLIVSRVVWGFSINIFTNNEYDESEWVRHGAYSDPLEVGRNYRSAYWSDGYLF
ncbi:hypothetical protein FWF48_02295 [Candidatus Saccharibacteria bacterium]|nr:hypothetical protein [Candidatus Saccharibacteria bacterium]